MKAGVTKMLRTTFKNITAGCQLFIVNMAPITLGGTCHCCRTGSSGTPTTPIQLTVPMPSVLMIPLLTAAGLAGFWLFYKSVDFFDHI